MILSEFSLISDLEQAKRMQFELQTRSVTSLFERHFPKFHTEDIWKVLIYCVDQVPETPINTIGGVLQVFIMEDVEQFFSLDNEEKRLWTFNRLQTGLDRAIKFTNWSPQPFHNTIQKLQNEGLRNEWIWKSISSRSRKFKAEVLVDHGIDECAISLRIKDRGGKIIKEQKILNGKPDEWFFKNYLGKLHWVDGETAVLLDKNGGETGKISMVKQSTYS